MVAAGAKVSACAAEWLRPGAPKVHAAADCCLRISLPCQQSCAAEGGCLLTCACMQEAFRIGIFSSASGRTVSTVIPMLEKAAGPRQIWPYQPAPPLQVRLALHPLPAVLMVCCDLPGSH